MHADWTVPSLTHFATILDAYSLEDILELNDRTTEEVLEFLVGEGYIKLPDIQPLEFDD